MNRKLAIKCALMGFFVALFGFLQDVRGQSKDVIEQAKKEGKVVFYTSLTLQELDQFVAPFTKKYPFLKVEPFRGNSEQLVQKITVEARAGRPLHDVVQTNAFDAWQLQKVGLLQSYRSPEARNFPDSYKDPDGDWTVNYTNYLVLGYNANSPEDEGSRGQIFTFAVQKATAVLSCTPTTISVALISWSELVGSGLLVLMCCQISIYILTVTTSRNHFRIFGSVSMFSRIGFRTRLTRPSRPQNCERVL